MTEAALPNLQGRKLRLLPGDRFGKLTAVNFIEYDDHGNARWEFSCDCGKPHRAIAHVVRRGDTKSCGCLRFKVIESGAKFGILTAVAPAGFGKKGVQKWTFKCDCGNSRIAEASPVRRGRILSCGCAQSSHQSRVAKIVAAYAIGADRAEEVAAKVLCDICESPETSRPSKNGHLRRLSVDHCHETGAVRGALCATCNRTLGFYEKGWRPGGPIAAFDLYLVKARNEALQRIS